jgi:hypothetical protein
MDSALTWIKTWIKTWIRRIPRNLLPPGAGVAGRDGSRIEKWRMSGNILAPVAISSGRAGGGTRAWTCAQRDPAMQEKESI